MQPPHPPIPEAPPLGPNPLPLHLGLASLIWLTWPLLWQRLRAESKDLKPYWSPALQKSAKQVHAASAKLSPEVFSSALAAEGLQRCHDYLLGVTRYRQQPQPPSLPAPPTLLTCGTIKLLDYAPELPGAPLLLVVPSIINRPDILDLSADHSLLRWLANQGIRPLLVDWGIPTEQDHALSVTDYVIRLRHLLAALQQKMPSSPLHLLGHCLGGNLALALAAHAQEALCSLILLSTPWDFQHGNTQLGDNAAALWQRIEPVLPPNGLISPSVMQSLFTMLQPMAIVEKFRQIGQGKMSAASLDHFTRVERWLNDGVPLPRLVMQEIVRDWYGANLPLRGGWRADGLLIKPRQLTMPALVMIPENDHIVSPGSAAALARQLGNAEIWSVPLGHVGLIVSRRAKALVWRKLASWIKG